MQDSELATLYREGHSINQIAKLVGWWPDKTRRKLLRLGVSLRSVSEGVHLSKSATPFTTTEELQALFDGLLLGDAAIDLGAIGSRLVLNQTIKHQSWVQMVGATLTRCGVQWGELEKPSGEVVIRGGSYQRSATWGLRTRSYVYFTDQRHRWYPNGVKCVPSDVDLSPISLAHWYFGDGGVGGQGYHARFCTDSFTVEDVTYLIQRLTALYGWRPTRTDRNRILLSLASDRQSLRKLVEPFTPDCFQYKLLLKTNEVQKHREQVLGLREQGQSYGSIVESTGLSKTQVATICKSAGLAGYIRDRTDLSAPY